MGRRARTRARARRRAVARRRQDRSGLLALLTVVVLVALGLMRDPQGEVRPYSLPSGPVPSIAAAMLPDLPIDDAYYPKSGPGTLVYAKGDGSVLGSAGPVKRFRVGVESNVVDELGEFTAIVERTLADSRSWVATKEHRFQRVPQEAPAEFTVTLVTRETAQHMCGAAGLDIRLGGVPYTSCQIPGRVVINLDRWRDSVPGYVDAGASLEAYRQYVINHEVGHVLGHQHEQCPGEGRPAPVMQQQTLGLNGCLPNPFPFPNGP